jgi:hypothetical protein
MRAEEDQREMDVNQSGLTQAESNELQARLDAEEWSALLAVQHTLANAPLVTPSAGFGDRVMQQLAVRQRQQARRRNLAGGVIFTLSSILFISLFFWLSPLDAFTQPTGWAEMLTTFTALVGVMTVVVQIGAAFARVLFELFGQETVVALSVFALLLTMLWSLVVTGWAPLNRLTTEAQSQ